MMNFNIQITSFKNCFTLFCALHIFNLSATNIPRIEAFQKEFGIQIILEDTFQSTYNEVSYEKINNEKRISFYIDSILTPEFKKYPDKYFDKIGLEKIVLCQNLSVNNQKRAALPDPIKKTLVFSIESTYQTEYLIHVLHHEMHHITEYALWQNMFYKWKKWERKNTKNFKYGTGGSTAYEEENVNWYAIEYPKTGFANLYSTTGQEEDRCEIMALIMTDSERKLLKNFSKTDKFLRRKIRLTLNLLDKLSQSKRNYWRIEMRKK